MILSIVLSHQDCDVVLSLQDCDVSSSLSHEQNHSGNVVGHKMCIENLSAK